MTPFTPDQASKIKELYQRVIDSEGTAELKEQARQKRVTAVTEALSVVSTLSRQERTFLIHYLAGETKTQAAESAGYSHPGKQGSRLAKSPKIRAAIDEFFHEQEMGAKELIGRMSQQARNEAADYIRPDGTVDIEAIIGDGNQHLIKGTKYDARGNLIVEFIPAFESQVKIGELNGLWKQNIDHTTGGEKLQVLIRYADNPDNNPA